MQNKLNLFGCCFCLCVGLNTLTGCGSEANPAQNQLDRLPPVKQELPIVSPGLAIPDQRAAAKFEVLLLGNSHVHSHDLAAMLELMLKQGRPQASSSVQALADYAFLDERLADGGRTLTAIQNRGWSHLVLQGQKYSTTGRYTYPTDAAQYWIALSKQRGATPVLFPEHAREGNVEEGGRVFQLHQMIALQEPACVAPIPLAWYAAIQQQGLTLHEADGNHANRTGAALTAFVLYEVITGDPADQLATIPQLALSATVQQQLKQLASATLQQHSACRFQG
jgi:hypothetical protein